MNKSPEFREDILRKYINPEKIEKAPEGFSEKIMQDIHAEKKPVAAGVPLIRKYMVPLISGLITVLLIIASILLSPSVVDYEVSPLIKPLMNFRLALPEFSFENFSNINLPILLVYIFPGIFMLSIFDRFLNSFFHRERR